MKHDGKNTGLFSGETTEDLVDEMELDTIGDGSDDLKNGTVDFEDDDIFDDMDDIEIFSLQEQLNKSLDMFNRFNKY